MRNIRIYKLIPVIILVSFLACGRRGALLTPESLAPQSVNNAAIVGHMLRWEAPTHDIDGRKLKSMRGYSIAAGNQSGVYQEIGFVADTRHAKLEALRVAKRQQGQSAHAVKLQDGDNIFSYEISVRGAATNSSSNPTSYKITPVAMNGVEGAGVVVDRR